MYLSTLAYRGKAEIYKHPKRDGMEGEGGTGTELTERQCSSVSDSRVTKRMCVSKLCFHLEPKQGRALSG